MGAREAQVEILVFVDADCLLTPTYIQDVVAALEQGYALAHEADPLAEGVFPSAGSVMLRSWFKPKAYTTGRGIAIWKNAFEEIGGYDESQDPSRVFVRILTWGEGCAIGLDIMP
jgi:hypothetical protein